MQITARYDTNARMSKGFATKLKGGNIVYNTSFLKLAMIPLRAWQRPYIPLVGIIELLAVRSTPRVNVSVCVECRPYMTIPGSTANFTDKRNILREYRHYAGSAPFCGRGLGKVNIRCPVQSFHIP